MRCAEVKSERYENGQVKRIVDVRIRELNPVQAENLSEVAAVVVMQAGIGGFATIYEDREMRQALVDLNALEDMALEFERRRAQYDPHLGHMS